MLGRMQRPLHNLVLLFGRALARVLVLLHRQTPYYGEHIIVYVSQGLLFEQSCTTESRQGTSFLSQVKSHPDGHWQKATKLMSQAHEDASYKLKGPYCKWVWALRRIWCRCWGSKATISDLSSKKMSPAGLSTCKQDCAPLSNGVRLLSFELLLTKVLFAQSVYSISYRNVQGEVETPGQPNVYSTKGFGSNIEPSPEKVRPLGCIP
jgi:hypothetical protein